MRKITAFFLFVVIMFFGCLFIEINTPSASGLTIGMLGLFGIVIDKLYLKEFINKAFLFASLALCLYGSTKGLSKKQENRIWGIVTLVSSVISIILIICLFKRYIS